MFVYVCIQFFRKRNIAIRNSVYGNGGDDDDDDDSSFGLSESESSKSGEGGRDEDSEFICSVKIQKGG